MHAHIARVSSPELELRERYCYQEPLTNTCVILVASSILVHDSPRSHHQASRLSGKAIATMNSPFSPIVQCLSWLAFVVLHAYCGLYFGAMALVYYSLPDTVLDVWLFYYGLSLGRDHDGTIAVVLGMIGAIHVCYLLWIFGWSLKKRRFVFAVYDVFVPRTTIPAHADVGFTHRIGVAYRSTVSRVGLLGVDGPYFDVILLCREIVETALQTQQAYWMSILIPRSQLNRCYVALLVLNCWSSALIHSAFHKVSTKRRVYLVICDCILDLVTSVGISTALIVVYAFDFDFEQGEFPNHKWYEDVWLMHVLSEFQIILVTAWGDLALRVVFALSMLGNLGNMKKLLCSTESSTDRRSASINRRKISVAPRQPSVSDVKVGLGQRQSETAVVSRLFQVLFFAWGIMLLVFHLYAEAMSGLPQCAMQVKPWGTSEPACSLFVLDCHDAGIRGDAEAVTKQWDTFDPTTAIGVVTRHCPDFEMPSSVTRFSRLRLLKFYNTTISSWNASAAISQTHHPNLVMLYLVRVNMTGGVLPAGLQTKDFPQTLMDIELCVTNLSELPSDLDSKWPSFGTIYVESSRLAEVPPSLVRMQPIVLSIAVNPISTIPAKLFKNSLGYLHVGGTLISELPGDVVDVSPFLKFRVDGTNVSYFWDWVDPIVANAGAVYNTIPTILATGSPYCSELQLVLKGNGSSARTPRHQGLSVALMNMSRENWATLHKVVSCDPWPPTSYPLEYEDAFSKLQSV
jgi:hypothetical protein